MSHIERKEYYMNKKDNFIKFLKTLPPFISDQNCCPRIQKLIDVWTVKSYSDMEHLAHTKLKPAMLMGPETVTHLLLAHYGIDKHQFSAADYDKFKRYLELFTTI